ncbi:MAG: hypothetical protein PPP56_06140 [Longimonas sp.]|uniref:hypothetical protein n=1 Tax=Longimonas sp. TaxID=2039626 RepID=UPI00335D338B
MRRFLAPIGSLVLLALVIAAFSPTSETTIEGTLVDTRCYGMNNEANVGNDHMVPGADGEMQTIEQCATACANMGIPAAILEDGEPGADTYVILAPAGQLAEHMDKEVRATGNVAINGGIIPDVLEVKDEDGNWQEVEIQVMM